MDSNVQIIGRNQKCLMCGKNKLNIIKVDYDIPFFGKSSLYNYNCTNCNYRQNDVFSDQQRGAARYSLEIEKPEDMSIRVIKNSLATVKIPGIITVESTHDSEGYITNVEGLLVRLRDMIEFSIQDQPREIVQQGKEHITKINNALQGKEKLTLVIEDTTGNSAIISEKATKSKID